jgi:hypothetical protein
MTTLTLDTISLPAGLRWMDRDDWQPVRQTVRQTLDGTLAVYHAPSLAGRPITLASAADEGWMSRATLDAVQALATTPGAVYALTIGATTYDVLFRHQEAPAITAEPILNRLAPVATDWFRVVLKFTAT